MAGLTKQERQDVGAAEGLKDRRLELFAQFMLARFPGESDRGYCGEWARRFVSGYEYNAGDSNSRAILDKLNKSIINV
jgi:hypothetical protein